MLLLLATAALATRGDGSSWWVESSLVRVMPTDGHATHTAHDHCARPPRADLLGWRRA